MELCVITDSCVSPCHRNRCFIISEPGSLREYLDILSNRQDSKGGFWYLLVRSLQIRIIAFLPDPYSCYNAFSHLDMRVEVKIPGSVEAYCIDDRGEKRVASENLWLETFLCGILRAYSYADDGSGDAIKKIVGVRRFNPITNTETEHKFLEAAEKLFFFGTSIHIKP
jgi:hypothetical protein